MQQRIKKVSLLERYHTAVPHGAGALFFIQVFSNLGYSVLYSTLVLYATQGLKMDDVLATSITGSFVALNYFLHLLGGYMGGRYLSYRTLFLLGVFLQVMGSLVIAIPHVNALLWGAAIFLSGSGLNVTCLNCMVTQLFEPEDKRRESVFLWNYSGMNISFFFGYAIGGYFQLTHNYTELFILSAIGNFTGCLLTLYHWPILKDRKTAYAEFPVKTRRLNRLLGLVGVVTLILILRVLLEQTEICNRIIMGIGFAMFILWIVLTIKEKNKLERNKIKAYILLTLSSVTFWALYQLAPMGLNLFIERNVDEHWLGFVMTPQWTQNINTIVIILGGPILSYVFTHMRDRGVNISIPLQFALALILIGAGFAILPIGIHFANSAHLTNYNWVLASYLLQSLGELFISPIGYAMIGQLAPFRLRGLMMGTWMMVIGVSAILSNHFSKLMLGATSSIDPAVTNASFSHTFNYLGWSAIVIGLLLLCIAPLIAYLANEGRMELA